jgi:hypothetical protein
MQHHNNAEIADIKARMERQLQAICQQYDFADFTFPSFLAWVEKYRSRPIRLVPEKLAPQFFGAWMAASDEDYIFYKEDTVSLHQGHILLHEMAHMLCGHPTLTLTEDVIAAHLRGELSISSLLLRSTRSGEMEWEAEILAALIQETIFAYERIQELTQVVLATAEDGELYHAIGLLD